MMTASPPRSAGVVSSLALSLSTRNGAYPAELIRMARLGEATGFSAVLLAERVADTLTLSQTLLAATTTVRIGTAVANARTRHPIMTALSASNLHTISGGRFVLGLGTANSMLNVSRLGLDGVAPLRWMEEYVAVLRTTWAGGPVDFTGDYFRIQALELDVPDSVAIPLQLAALRPGMQRLAARVADGVILNLCPLDALPGLLANLSTGGEGRLPGLADLTISCVVHCCVGEDGPRAREAASHILLDYVRHPSVARLLREDLGDDVLAAVQGDVLAGRRGLAAARLPATVVDRFVAAGTPEDCARRLLAYRSAGVDTVIVSPHRVDSDLAESSQAMAACYRHGLAESLGGRARCRPQLPPPRRLAT